MKRIALVISKIKSIVFGQKTAVRDLGYTISSQVISMVSGFFSTVLIARGLGPSGLGNYALLTSVPNFLVQISDLGIGQTTVRFASRAVFANDNKTQFSALRWAFRVRISVIVLSSISFCFIMPVVTRMIWHAPDLVYVAELSLFIGLFGSLSLVPFSYFQSKKDFRSFGLITIAQKLMVFLGVFTIFILSAWSLFNIITITILTTGIGALICLRAVPKEAIYDKGELRRLIGGSRVFSSLFSINGIVPNSSLDSANPGKFMYLMVLSTILIGLIMQADVWLMGAYLNKGQVGIYNAGMRFALPLSFVLNSLQVILWPRISAIKNSVDTIKVLGKIFRICLLVSAGGVLYSVIVPGTAPLLLGSAYKKSVLLGQLLSLRYCLAILINPIYLVGYNFGLVNIYWLINLFQLATVIVINILLLPRFGPIGSAIALVANDLLGFILIGSLVLRRVHRMK